MPLVSSRMMTKSTPLSTLALSGAESDNAGWATIGLKLAYRSYLLRRPRRLPALRAAAGTSFVSGPPVAPHRIASASSIASTVSGGITLPVARYGMMPYCASRNTMGTLRLRGHFGADALAADHGDLDHVGRIIHALLPAVSLAKWIQGRSARSAA